MHGETEVPQKMEVNPESIRIGIVFVKASTGTSSGAFVFILVSE
jgi:hypothetical protein